jgi:hypothetical protein
MPKKKTTKKSEFKTLLREFGEKSVGIIASSIEKVNFVKIIKNMGNIKAKMKKYVSSFILVIAGTVLIAMGIASYVNYLFPVLSNGFSEMIVGAALVIISIIVCKGGK